MEELKDMSAAMDDEPAVLCSSQPISETGLAILIAEKRRLKPVVNTSAAGFLWSGFGEELQT